MPTSLIGGERRCGVCWQYRAGSRLSGGGKRFSVIKRTQWRKISNKKHACSPIFTFSRPWGVDRWRWKSREEVHRILERSFNPRAAFSTGFLSCSLQEFVEDRGTGKSQYGLVQTWLSLYRDPERSELRGGFRKLAIYREILVI
jgi:hypothetical protein